MSPMPMEVRYNAAKKMENCFPVAYRHEISLHDAGHIGEIPANRVSTTRPCIHQFQDFHLQLLDRVEGDG